MKFTKKQKKGKGEADKCAVYNFCPFIFSLSFLQNEREKESKASQGGKYEC